MYYKKVKEIYKHGGLTFLLNRMLDYSMVKLKRLFQQEDIGNLKKWQLLKDKFKGERVFLIGSGPSINKTPLYLLKDEYTMCVNKVDLLLERLNWHPDFYVVTDDMKVIENQDVINNFIVPKTEYCFFPDLHPSNINFKKYIKPKQNTYWLNTDEPCFTKDLPKCGINNTVALAGLQILAYLGFSEIYFVGIDMDFKERKINELLNQTDVITDSDDDCNHFDPRYDGRGSSYTIPILDAMFGNFEVAKHFYEDSQTNIYNSTVGGNLETFKRIDVKTVLKMKPENEEKLFIELIGHDPSIYNFDKLMEENTKLSTLNEFDCKLNSFIIDEQKFSLFLNEAIFTHIPFGPFKEKYFFKKREGVKNI